MSHKYEFFNNCIILDLETTSNDANTCEIIQTGFCLKNNNEWQMFEDLFKPSIKIPPKVEALCYITNEMVQDKQSFYSKLQFYQGVVDSYSHGYYVAHNHNFEKITLDNHGVKIDENRWICTWSLVQKLFNDCDSIEETNLGYLRFALDLDVPDDMYCHRAGNDSYITAKLLEFIVDFMEEKQLIDKNQPYGPQLQEFMNTPIILKRMPFGKYKNYKIDDLPEDYVKWMVEKMDALQPESDKYDPNMVATVEDLIERKNYFK